MQFIIAHHFLKAHLQVSKRQGSLSKGFGLFFCWFFFWWKNDMSTDKPLKHTPFLQCQSATQCSYIYQGFW